MAHPDTARRCPTTADGELPAGERIKYFLGRHLTERDFADADNYPLTHLRAHNWMLHGWGVVAGLVVDHFDAEALPECRQQWVIVNKGAALDPLGRLVVVPKTTAVRLPTLSDCATEPQPGGDCCPHPDDPTAPVLPPVGPFLLCLRYRECDTEPVPVVVSHPCGTAKTKPGRVRETYDWCLIAVKDTPAPGCWGSPPPPECPPPKTDDDRTCEPAGEFAPLRPCGADVVPVALIIPKGKTWDEGFDINLHGRRYVPGPLHPTTLTRVCDIDWPHAGIVSFAAIQKHLRFEVTLSGPLDWSMAVGADATTAYAKDTEWPLYDGPQVFRVYYTHKAENHQPRWLWPRRVRVGRGMKLVAFELDPEGCNETRRLFELLDRTKADDLVMIHLELRCGFLMDRCGRAVDGDHLRNRRPSAPSREPPGDANLPSGDGTPGGTFESWFTLTTGESRL